MSTVETQTDYGLMNGYPWRIHEGDCIPQMHAIADEHGAAFDMAVFSPPFPSLYAYTSEPQDIGNSEDISGAGEAKLHLSFFYKAIARIIKPGRVIMVHVAQIPRMKRSGGVGLCDFRGMNIRLGERAGLVYEYDWSVRKNPQAQAIRTRSRELQFQGLETDRALARGALPDYLIKFRVPGDNAKKIDGKGEVSREQWIQYAENNWSDIKETNTLNVKEGRGDDDTKHICPLQLGVIDRLVRMYTDPGEIVFTPFAGIGSELYQSLLRGRRAYGCEIKPEYIEAAKANCERAVRIAEQDSRQLFWKAKP